MSINGTRVKSQDLVVRTEGLTKRYGNVAAVADLNLCVRRGEVYGFLGPNGAGKTTTLRMLVGLVRPTHGRADVQGGPAGSPESLARIGVMVETPAFYPFLSGRDNLQVLARQAGVARKRIAEVLEIVGMAGRGADRFAAYSLGMKQRLGVAAALLKDPELLILDEPTNGLDPIGMADMRTLIRSFGNDGKTVLLSSHQLGEVQQLCDRVGVIFKGSMKTEGTVAELRGSVSLVVRATPTSRAEACLVELVGRQNVTVRDDEIHLEVEPHEGAAISRKLIGAGIDLYEMRRDERSLEDVFLSMSAAVSDGEDRVA
jgi:ABC-2 type transport system ATP-binding protein